MYNFFRENEEHKKHLYTDLACERGRACKNKLGMEFTKIHSPIGIWEHLKVIDEEAAKSIDRPCGIYSTLNLMQLDLLDEEDISDATEEVAKRLCIICDDIATTPAKILIVGLGNERLTPDTIGPKTASLIKPTLHISEYDKSLFESLECSEIAILRPDVTVHTGMDSFSIIKSTCDSLSPNIIIAIDSIMTHSKERLGSTIQISNTGIFPGGIGNLKSAITKSSMGIPVIGIGVPTVMDFRCKKEESEDFSGNGTFYVSPREIDEITDTAAKIISGAINQAFGFCY